MLSTHTILSFPASIQGFTVSRFRTNRATRCRYLHPFCWTSMGSSTRRTAILTPCYTLPIRARHSQAFSLLNLQSRAEATREVRPRRERRALPARPDGERARLHARAAAASARGQARLRWRWRQRAAVPFQVFAQGRDGRGRVAADAHGDDRRGGRTSGSGSSGSGSSGSTPAGTTSFVAFSSTSDINSAQLDVTKYIFPIYKVTDYAVVLDYRPMPNAGVWEDETIVDLGGSQEVEVEGSGET